MGRKINRQARGKTQSKFESNLIAGLLSERAGKAKKSSGMPTLDPRLVGKPSGFISTHSPASRYTDSKGAAGYLGISRAKFFRLRSKGHFHPSPITGRYHMDDLDSEARGLSAPDPQGSCPNQENSEGLRNTPPNRLRARRGANQEA